ncbi:transcriptional regulator family: Histone-like TF [Agaricus bisporus var. burnettii]|uniref:DNA polymerase epsilon subunit D n=1 Tax=Agaricus bisporus var. burnettii TaxID=192524 RepID=A0A8H7C1P2_AGABI|nr:transcriptional regulator family: Histone-like TF [Agaricus bisporus var. burnettii]
MPRKDASGGQVSAEAQQAQLTDGIENFELPKSVVTKIAKSALPDGAKLQKDTVLALVKGSTVFINYLAATAHDVALSKQHKSISASDIFKALELVEFNHLSPMLESQFQAYRTLPKNEKGKKANGAGSSSARTTTSSATANGTTTPVVSNGNPYPNVARLSNPYPAIAPDDDNQQQQQDDSPFTHEPLSISNVVEAPMDVDDPN